MNHGSERYRKIMAQLDALGVTTNIVRIGPKWYELHMNYEIIKAAHNRGTCNKHLSKILANQKEHKMSFFKQLQGVAPGVLLTMTIMEKDGSFTVAIIPDSFKHLQPLTLEGTADELDEGFIEAIRQPITTILGLKTNAEQFVQQVVPAPEAKEPAPVPKITAEDAVPSESPEVPESAAVDNPAPETKKGRGGARPGAGKKPKAAQPEPKAESDPVDIPEGWVVGAQVQYVSPSPLRGEVGVIEQVLDRVGAFVVKFDPQFGIQTIELKDLALYTPATEEVAQQPATTPDPEEPIPTLLPTVDESDGIATGPEGNEVNAEDVPEEPVPVDALEESPAAPSTDFASGFLDDF